MPTVKRAATDADKRRFIRRTFDTIKEHFESGLDEFGVGNDAVECDFQPNTAADFTAEVFVDGKTCCRCRIWQGGLVSSDGISYAEGNSIPGTNTNNENPVNSGSRLRVKA